MQCRETDQLHQECINVQWTYSLILVFHKIGGCAIAQAVSRWLPTAVEWVRAPSGHVGFVIDKVALGQVFSEYFGFPCQSSWVDPVGFHPPLIEIKKNHKIGTSLYHGLFENILCWHLAEKFLNCVDNLTAVKRVWFISVKKNHAWCGWVNNVFNFNF
jgi:hypothetical protein